MEVILIVIVFMLSPSGNGYTKTKYVEVVPTYEQCELAAIIIRKDKELNTPGSYVFSVECELRRTPE